ncbi:MAG: 1-acyl-sn-glycerol-3-phosphate acyltransferase, partial [Bacteroidota bacterium]
MKQFSMLVYRGLRIMSRWFLRILYPGMMVEGVEHVSGKGPFLLAAYHPNTLIDPLILGIHLPRRLYFMANAGIFANPAMGQFLRFCGVIPIARRGIDGEAGRKVDNNKSFEEAYQLFERNGAMFVAPEGGSELERRIRRPLKTGTARMALAVEKRNNWQLGMTIIPGAGNYEEPLRCFSRVFVRFGPPIKVADWQTAYEASPRQAAKDLTAHLEEKMAEIVIDNKDKAQERFLRPLDRALQNDQPMLPDAHHFRIKRLLAKLKELPVETYGDLEKKANKYQQWLKKEKIDDAVLSNHPVKKGALGLWLGLPLFLYGAINHALLVWLPEVVWGRLDIYRNYAGTVRGLIGTILLPIIYALQSWIVSLFVGGWYWLYLLTLPVFGLFALAY